MAVIASPEVRAAMTFAVQGARPHCVVLADGLKGVPVFAVSGRQVTRVRLGNRIVGSVYEDADARHCLLGGLGPTARTLAATEYSRTDEAKKLVTVVLRMIKSF